MQAEIQTETVGQIEMTDGERSLSKQKVFYCTSIFCNKEKTLQHNSKEKANLRTFLTLCQQDMRPVKAGRCQFYTSGNGYIYENYYATVSQVSFVKFVCLPVIT